MKWTAHSATDSLAFEEVIERLSRRSEVDGIMAIGSVGGEHFKPYSDYDLLLVLNQMPVPLTLITTHIDGRLAEILVTDFEKIDQVMVSNDPIVAESQDAQLIYWLQHGTIHFDRTGKLGVGQKLLAVGSWIQSEPKRAVLYGRWQNTNYNIAQNRRMLEADDTVYQTTVDLRFLYMMTQLWSDYFLVRAIPGRGEKQEIRYLEENDPSFLEKFRQLLAAGDRYMRQQYYESLAGEVFAPFAPMWEEQTTSVVIRSGTSWQPDTLREGLRFWHRLVDIEEEI